jgi:hypothetical protein
VAARRARAAIDASDWFSPANDTGGFGAAAASHASTLDTDSEVDLQTILTRSMPVLSRLISKLRDADTKKEATHWLNKTDQLIKHAQTR